MDALRSRDPTRMEALLAADPGAVRASAPDGTPLLTMALYVRSGAVVDLLLARGAAPTPFELAIMGPERELIDAVKRAPAVLRATSPDGFTLLHLAAHFGHAPLVRALIAAGADPDARSTNAMRNTPLHAAAAGASEAAIEALVASGARIDERDAHGFTPLFNAAANGLLDAVELLLARGADPDATGDDGRTPTSVAEAQGEEAVVRLLAEARAKRRA